MLKQEGIFFKISLNFKAIMIGLLTFPFFALVSKKHEELHFKIRHASFSI